MIRWMSVCMWVCVCLQTNECVIFGFYCLSAAIKLKLKQRSEKKKRTEKNRNKNMKIQNRFYSSLITMSMEKKDFLFDSCVCLFVCFFLLFFPIMLRCFRKQQCFNFDAELRQLVFVYCCVIIINATRFAIVSMWTKSLRLLYLFCIISVTKQVLNTSQVIAREWPTDRPTELNTIKPASKPKQRKFACAFELFIILLITNVSFPSSPKNVPNSF